MSDQQELQTIYANRFAGQEAPRERVWKVLTRHYFQQWIRPKATVLDLGAGYCEFINNIRANRKIAVDFNPETPRRAAPGVEVVMQDVSKPWAVHDTSVDVVFTSNFFEHLANKQNFLRCLSEIHRVLRTNGRLIAMGPNIRFCFDVYWDFLDHHLPLSDRSIREAVEVAGFRTETLIPRFLPFTMQGKLPPSSTLVRMYLLLPPAWRLLGKQFLLVATKMSA